MARVDDIFCEDIAEIKPSGIHSYNDVLICAWYNAVFSSLPLVQLLQVVAMEDVSMASGNLVPGVRYIIN